MQSPLKLCKQFICVFSMLLFITSSGFAQIKRFQKSESSLREFEKRSFKTVQLFAEEDDPSGWISVDDGETYRLREVYFNPVLINRIGALESGDKLVGYLFDDISIEFTVYRVKDYISGGEVFADDGKGASLIIFVKDGKISLKVVIRNAEKSYRCSYNEDEARHVIKEIESEYGKKARIEKAVAAARAAGPKTVKIFAEDDDPSNRLPWDDGNYKFHTYARRRKATINPQLLGDRIHEVLVGDTLVGKLFDDEYFEGVVTECEKDHLGTRLSLNSGDNRYFLDSIYLRVRENSIHLEIDDHSRRKGFKVHSYWQKPYHVVIEIDPSKIPPFICGTGMSVSEQRELSRKVAREHPTLAFIYYRNEGGANNWGEVQRLPAAYANRGSENSVQVAAISSNNAVVGNSYGFKSTQFFSRNHGGNGTWQEIKKQTSFNIANLSTYPNPVAISGKYAVIGAVDRDDQGAESKVAYILRLDQIDWNGLDKAIKLFPTDSYKGFGQVSSVDMSGNTAIIGVNLGRSKNPGFAHIFSRNHGGADNWGEVKKLTSPGSPRNDGFGNAVAVSGDYAIVGAYGENTAYIYSRNQGGADTWGLVKKLTASGERNALYGVSVDISGDIAIVGIRSYKYPGAAYLFSRNHGGVDNWGEIKKLVVTDYQDIEYFGSSVAISGDNVIVGASGNDAAYIYGRNQGGTDNWGRVKKLTSPYRTGFGQSVDISGDYAIVWKEGVLNVEIASDAKNTSSKK